jgi:hypothetical protein
MPIFMEMEGIRGEIRGDTIGPDTLTFKESGTQPAPPPPPAPAPVLTGGKERHGDGEVDLGVLNEGPETSGQQGPTGDLSVVGEVTANGRMAPYEADWSLAL